MTHPESAQERVATDTIGHPLRCCDEHEVYDPDCARGDLPEITITLPQNVWQTVEDVLCAYEQDALHHTTRTDLERAIAALKGFGSVEELRAYRDE